MDLPFRAIVSSENETASIAADLAAQLKKGDIFILSGVLGTGKTFFVKAVLEEFGISWGNSPSFTIINEYAGVNKFVHMDFYRIKSINELFDIGIEEYLNDKESIIFIEWGNLFPAILPDQRFEISIKFMNVSDREILISKHG